MTMRMAQNAPQHADEAEVQMIEAESRDRADRHERRGRAGDAAADVQLAYGETAARGVAGASSELPHQEQIQRSFGDFDVSGIRTQQGGAASEASERLGAEAYATGDKIAFKQAPDLHTAAHEAAHVVQQRAGVQLKGGVGVEGDAYEQHADAVADKVVAGEPADYLLAQMASPGAKAAAAPGVQMQVTPKEKLPVGEEGFQQMWDAHPHNYMTDGTENTSSEEVRE